MIEDTGNLIQRRISNAKNYADEGYYDKANAFALIAIADLLYEIVEISERFSDKLGQFAGIGDMVSSHILPALFAGIKSSPD